MIAERRAADARIRRRRRDRLAGRALLRRPHQGLCREARLMRLDVLKAMNAARARAARRRVVTRLADGEQRFVAGRARLAPIRWRPQIEAALRMGKSGAVTVDGEDYFLTVQAPSPRLTLIGAVHISQALAPMARIAGLDVTIIDPRTAFATPERFPDTPVLAEWPDEALAARAARPLHRDLPPDPRSEDRRSRRSRSRSRPTASTSARSARAKTHAKRIERMRAQGFDEAALARIHAPIGLDIGAVSPAEIAVSILGEIVASLRKKPLARGKRGGMKFGSVPDRRGRRRDPRPCRADRGRRAQEGRRRHRRTPAHAWRRRASTSVVAARLEEGDVGENEAALELAKRLAGAHVRCAAAVHRTGQPVRRRRAGLAVIDAAAIDRINAIDEAITVATLPRFEPSAIGDMIATVKIIPFATPARRRSKRCARGARRCERRRGRAVPAAARRASSRRCCRGSRRASSPRRCACSKRASRRPGRASSRTRRRRTRSAPLADALRDGSRLAPTRSSSSAPPRSPTGATSSPPRSRRSAGRIERFGMPVDPGNLLLLARRAATTAILGAPGCARSPKENGFDWVLQRLHRRRSDVAPPTSAPWASAAS